MGLSVVNIYKYIQNRKCICTICIDLFIHLLLVGKVWKRKEEDKIQIHDDESVATEWDEVLANATEEELVDLAGTGSFILN